MEQDPGVVIVSEGPARSTRQRHNVRSNAAAETTAQMLQTVQSASDKAYTTIERMFGRVGWLKSPDSLNATSSRDASPISEYTLTRSDMHGLEISAGVDLGNRFRKQWDTMQSQNIRNIRAGERMRRRTAEVAEIHRTREMRIARVGQMASATDDCGKLITTITAGIARLADTLRAVEESLDKLDRLQELYDVSVHVRQAEEGVAAISRQKVKEYDAKKQAYARDIKRERQRVHDREMAQLAERQAVYAQQYTQDLKLYHSEQRGTVDAIEKLPRHSGDPRNPDSSEEAQQHTIASQKNSAAQHAKPTQDLKDVVIDDLIGGDDDLDDFYAD